MTKRFSTPASFNPATGVIDGSNIANLNPNLVLAIVNSTARAFLYDLVTPGLGYVSVTGMRMTVEVATAGFSSTDNIIVIWDDGAVFAVSDPANAPFSGGVPMIVGTSYAPLRSVRVVATVAGNVVFQFPDGSTIPEPVQVGAQTFPYAVTQIVSAGTTAVATFYSLK